MISSIVYEFNFDIISIFLFLFYTAIIFSNLCFLFRQHLFKFHEKESHSFVWIIQLDNHVFFQVKQLFFYQNDRNMLWALRSIYLKVHICSILLHCQLSFNFLPKTFFVINLPLLLRHFYQNLMLTIYLLNIWNSYIYFWSHHILVLLITNHFMLVSCSISVSK